jgi:hypothetical protein
MANTYLTRTNSSPTNAKKYTWSSWNKIDSGGWYPFFSTTHQGGHSYIGFGASGSSFGVIEHGDSAGTLYYLSTSSIQRDTSGWYHVVVQFDSTQSTASDRIKIYINNVLQTSFGNSDYPSQNLDSWFVDATTIEIGRRSQGSGQYYSGLISHAHFIDGTVYAPSTFGETDSTTGEWKIKTDPGISTANYGNNGFWMFKDNNSLNDNSGNGNNFSLGGGTLTKTEDNPSNVFNLFNKLVSQTGGVAGRNSTIDAQMFNGNTTIATSIAYWTPQLGNMEMFSGKYYWEQKFEVDGTPSNYLSYIGIEATDTAGTNLGSPSGRNTDAIAYGSGGDVNKSNGNVATYDTWTAGDIVMCAVDLDNNYIYFGKNGTWQNSGDPTSGATGTGGIAVTTGKSYITAGTIHRGGNYSINTTYSYAKCNFGNGYFGTTAVSSAGTNASGIGIFEYDVPTGYTALSTKGLNL